MKKRFTAVFMIKIAVITLIVGLFHGKPYPIHFIDQAQAEMLAIKSAQEECQRDGDADCKHFHAKSRENVKGWLVFVNRPDTDGYDNPYSKVGVYRLGNYTSQDTFMDFGDIDYKPPSP